MSPVTVALRVSGVVVAVRSSGLEVTVYSVMGLPPSEGGALQLTVAWASPRVAAPMVGARVWRG